MKVTNLTDKVQEILVKEYVGGEYTIYLEPHGSTDVEGGYVVEDEGTKGISVEKKTPVVPQTPKEVPIESPKVIPETPAEVEPEEEEEELGSTSDQYVCEECGAEFASARGLASHKSKAHSN